MNKEAIRICWGYDDICRAVAYRDAAYFGKGEVRIFLHSEPGEIPHAVLFRYDREKHPQYSRMDEAELSRCAETEDALTKLTVSKRAVADAVLAWEYQGRRPTGVRFEGSGESIRAVLLFAPERDAAQVLHPSFRAAPGELARRFSLNEPLFTASVESDGRVCAIFGSRVLRFPWERGWEAAELLDFSGAYTRLTMIHPLSGEYLERVHTNAQRASFGIFSA